MNTRFVALIFGVLALRLAAAPLDVVPFGLPLPDGVGAMWEDPREIHEVVVRFQSAAPAAERLGLEYWGSWWPERHLPKDQEPGGGDIGWLELGNWHSYSWRKADALIRIEGTTARISFRPVNAAEVPKAKDYPAEFRYTLKIRLTSPEPLPKILSLSAYTDSALVTARARVVWQKPPPRLPRFEAFNGAVEQVKSTSPFSQTLNLLVASNPDPNTFDRTLITVRSAETVFTFKYDDLAAGALFLPEFGVAVLPETDARTYTQVAAAQSATAGQTLYDRVARLPEQSWSAAWDSMPPKKSRIYFPMGLDAGRQRFQLAADGSVLFRANDHYLKARPGLDTPRLRQEPAPVKVRFGLTAQPIARTIEEESLPICRTTWDLGALRVYQVALVTPLHGAQADGPVPAPDATAVFLARFTFTNPSDTPQTATLPVQWSAGGKPIAPPTRDADGLLYDGELCRGQVVDPTAPDIRAETLTWSWEIPARSARSVVVKIPYVLLPHQGEAQSLARLDFERELAATAGYWRRRLDESARLLTPEPMLNEFYRAHASHLLVNCEGEPGSARRFARVGSFSYGAYGNESCMMVADLERRGYHREAQECLDAWLHYQGTVALPGSFASKEGVLYGAGGYEAGGYNQHHGWILWALAEHYRFTRDATWLKQAAPGIFKGAQWIISETKRTESRHPLERGLLPAGSLEDIGDWWTWLSTSCYTWRGLDAAAWALQQARHPEAKTVRRAADAYHTALITNFMEASRRSPVVRLRDGTAVPQIPSHVHRRGRSFGWICQTLEGPIHLLITGALNPRSREATWILKDYEDNLYLSNQYGYTLDNFERDWFGRGGMSMQACLLLDVEPYLYRDDVQHALRALFNGQAVSYFPDVRMNTEHALPAMGDWRGDHFKSSDEANTAGWLRQLFIREDGNQLLLGQAIPRSWLQPGQTCGMERAATHFGPMSLTYQAAQHGITVHLTAPTRNPPQSIQIRFREPLGRAITSATVDGRAYSNFKGDWLRLPGTTGRTKIVVHFNPAQ